MKQSQEDKIISEFLNSIGPWHEFIVIGGGFALFIYKLYLYLYLIETKECVGEWNIAPYMANTHYLKQTQILFCFDVGMDKSCIMSRLLTCAGDIMYSIGNSYPIKGHQPLQPTPQPNSANKQDNDIISLRLKKLALTDSSTKSTKSLIGRQFCSATNKDISFGEFLKTEGYIGIPEDLEITLTPTFAYYGVPAYSTLLETIKDRNLAKEKGIMLSGLPGTGKTFFARTFAKFLRLQLKSSVNIEELSAGKLLHEQVGKTEKNIRCLFEKAKSDEGKLYVIIIDEFDSIGQSRALAGNRWEISQVNEFLCCMDGLQELSNTLVIGMTNNLDLIDDALLRSGRFGTIIQMPLPTKNYRKDLFELYSCELNKKKLIKNDVDYEQLADISEGFTGADIRGIVEKVNRIAFSRLYRQFEKNKMPLADINKHPAGIILMKDFLEEIHSLYSEKNRVKSSNNGKLQSKL